MDKSAKPFIPYGRQLIDKGDIDAVVEVLESDWLTTGPKVEEFEEALAGFCGVPHAVAVSSGTAALHLAMLSLGVGPGDEVIVPAITFVATANAVLFVGATPMFADVESETLLIKPESVERLVNLRTKAVIAVDYAGQPCDYDKLESIASKHGLALVADACHSLGASYKGRPVGSLADITVFSFHPVKPITTGEGGALLTDDPNVAQQAKRLRNHGIDLDFRQRASRASWEYDMIELGFNYRITDIQCALGISQLEKLLVWMKRRNEIAMKYRRTLEEMQDFSPLLIRPGVECGYHLFVALLKDSRMRERFFHFMRSMGIGVNVHYKPVYLHSYYQGLGYCRGLCPVAEDVYGRMVSLPIYHGMKEEYVDYVLRRVVEFAYDRLGDDQKK